MSPSSVSFAQTLQLTCPECGAAFDCEAWLVVHTVERPDLVERMAAARLHEVNCPRGHSGQVDLPLLLFRPGVTPLFLFSPAQSTTGEEDQDQASWLFAQLRERLGLTWQD